MIVNIITLIVASGLIAFIIWWFFDKHHEQTQQATLAQHNKQQVATIVVKGGYSPQTLVLQAGIPAQVNFDMQDATACLAHIVFEKLGIDKDLTKQKITTINIPTNHPGEIDYACGMNMFHGKILIKKRGN